MTVYKADATGGYTDNNARIVTLYGVGAITAGNSVMIDPTDETNGLGFSVEQADEDDSPLACGIALDTITASGPIRVLVAGTTSLGTASGAGAINLKEAVGSGTNGGDGRLKAVGTCAATIQPFAICLNAFTSGTADGVIMLIDRGFFKHS